MNVKILLIAIAAVSLGSCSTAYRSGQTPDDVYYSPIRTVEENTKREERRDERVDAEDREIRMSTRDRRWRSWDNDYDYRYDPYRYGYSYGGYYYNPYYYPYPVYSGYGWSYVNPKNTTPRMANLAAYNPKALVVNNPKTGETKWVNAPKTYNSNNRNNNGNGLVRRILNSDNSNNNNSNNNRTYNPSSNNNSSGSSSSGRSGSGSSGAPVSRPSRGN